MVLPYHVKVHTDIWYLYMLCIYIYIYVGGEGVVHAVKYSQSICWKEVRVNVQ